MKNFLAVFAVIFAACTSKITTTEVLLTAESGEKCSPAPAVTFTKKLLPYKASVNLSAERQTVDGFGGSLTESSAFVLACLDSAQRAEILHCSVLLLRRINLRSTYHTMKHGTMLSEYLRQAR